MKLIEHIVRNDRPFTEIVTADYIMVTPYTARGYGIFDEVRARFKNPDDPFEYIPVKLKALKGRSRSTDQESATGFYPHAGLLEHVPVPAPLPDHGDEPQPPAGADVLPALPRRRRAGAGRPRLGRRGGHGEVPDPDDAGVGMRGLPQDGRPRGRPVPGLLRLRRRLRPPQGRLVSRTCSPPASRGRTCRPSERWRALQWLGERTAKDPRFAVAMVEHVYYILTGRKVLLPPKDLDDPLYAARRRAYQEQRRQIEAIAGALRRVGLQPQERLQGLDRLRLLPRRRPGDRADDPARRAELDDVGLVRMLAPEQVERKVSAVFGEPWGRLQDQLAILYGGIDSQGGHRARRRPERGDGGDPAASWPTTWRASTPLRDFARKPAERRLFPGIEPDVLPGSSPEADATIRRAIVHLHELHPRAVTTPPIPTEVARTFDLFAGIVADAEVAKGPRRPRDLLLPGQTSPTPPPTRITPSAPGAPWSPTCSAGPNSFTSESAPCAAISSSSAPWPASAWPSRSGSRRRPARETRRTTAYDGPVLRRLQRLGRLGHDLPDGPQGRRRASTASTSEGDILTRGAHKFAPTAKHIQGGMSNEDFYAEFGDELLVLNGLDYSVNNHSPGARYMATGKLDSLAYPTFAALVAACQGPACPLSFLTFGNYSATGNLVAMSRVPYLQSLRKLANADAVDGNERSPYHDDFALDRDRAGARRPRPSPAPPSPRLPRAEHAENMLYAAQVNSKALQRVTPYIPPRVPKERLSQQADIALASFKAGVCVSANLSIGQFDSHANNDADQMKLIPEFLAGIGYLLRRAEDLKIRDRLVDRRPERDGPHAELQRRQRQGPLVDRLGHVPGPGHQGQPRHRRHRREAVPRPRSTRRPWPATARTGIRVRPEHIHAALRDLAGIADHPFSQRFPLGVAENERLRGFWG